MNCSLSSGQMKKYIIIHRADCFKAIGSGKPLFQIMLQENVNNSNTAGAGIRGGGSSVFRRKFVNFYHLDGLTVIKLLNIILMKKPFFA